MREIDIDKSIRTGTLEFYDTLQGKIVRWTERGIFYLIAGLFIYFPLKNIWAGLITSNLPISQIVYAVLFFLIGSCLVYSLVHLDRLSLIKGNDKETNKHFMSSLLNETFVDTKFYFIEDRLIGTRPWKMKKPGKEIIVIFNDSDIFINITHKVRFGDIDSPFHVLINQTDIKEIRNRFSEKRSRYYQNSYPASSQIVDSKPLG